MRLVLYQPDIPQNAGTILRLAACLGIGVDIVEPCGFVWSEPRLRRAGMDYLEFAAVARHTSWQALLDARAPGRLVLLTTRGATPLPRTRFAPDDYLVLGRESAGAPEALHAAADLAVRVPMVAGARSLNVAVTAGIVLAEALRQTEGWPPDPS